MTHVCYNKVTIGASEEIINMLVENKFLFDSLLPLDNDDSEYREKFWGTKTDRTEYELVQKGKTGLEIKFITPLNAPFKIFDYVIETYDVWLKCEWSEQGGTAGTYIGKKGSDYLDVAWYDWSLEEWITRMG
jgi:hypothetical protein